LALPIPIPGLALWKAIRAQRKLAVILADCARKSKAKMAQPGAQADCLLDVWMESMLGKGKYDAEVADSEEGAGASSEKTQFTDAEIASVLVTFLFASQDASTSSLVWVNELLYSHPDVLQRVREELHQLLNIPMPTKETSTASNLETHLKDITFTPEILSKAEYTRQVVLEVLRYRPPATMVPYEAVKEFPLDSQQYTVPKGTLVLPSIWCSRLTGFKDAGKLNSACNG
jgi:cytochrome P450 family 710 subfamily A protein